MVAVIEQHLIVINKNFGAEKSTQRRVILLSFPLSSRKIKKKAVASSKHAVLTAMRLALVFRRPTYRDKMNIFLVHSYDGMNSKLQGMPDHL